MSCCNIEKPDYSKHLEGLKKHFDEVLLECTEQYNVLTLQDRANKNNYDWIVWLQIKIPFKDHNSHNGHSDEKYIEGVCKDVLDWVELLKNFEKKTAPKQISLFNDGSQDIELEKEPEKPQSAEEKSWSKYFRDIEKVKKRNLMKQYSFFELFDYTCWYAYYEPYVVESWTNKLPKNNLEMIALIKEAIIEESKGVDSSSERYWWDNHDYLTEVDALSDYELIDWVRSGIRLYLVPFTRYFHVGTDNSYTSRVHEESTEYRFWFDGEKIIGSSWLKVNLPKYELFDLEFIAWLRDFYNIKKIEPVTDEEMLRESFERLFSFILDEDYDYIGRIQKCKNWKELKADVNSYATSKNIKINNGGSCGPVHDGYGIDISKWNGVELKISQRATDRKQMQRSFDGLDYDGKSWSVNIYTLKGDDVYKKAFDFLKEEGIKQTSIFDFLAA